MLFSQKLNNYNLSINDIFHNLKYAEDKNVVDLYVYINEQGMLSVNIGEPNFPIDDETVYFHSRFKISKEEEVDKDGNPQLETYITAYYVDDVTEEETMMCLPADGFDDDDNWEESYDD